MSKNVAVFVDVANLYYAARGQDVDLDYVTLLKHATKGRDLIRAYAYSGLDPDNENQRKFLDFLGKNGYRVVAKDIRKFGDGRVKANLDIELVVDLFRLADRMDVAVIVSGDGDFAPAIRALQDRGVRCEVISFKPNTSSDLFAVADEFVDVMKIVAIGREKDAKGVGAPEMPAKEVNPDVGFREASPSVAAAALAAARGDGEPAIVGRGRGRTTAGRRAERGSRPARSRARASAPDVTSGAPPAAAEASTSLDGDEAGTGRRRRRRGGRGRGRRGRRGEPIEAAEDQPAIGTGEIGWQELDSLEELGDLEGGGDLGPEREPAFEEADAATLAELGLSAQPEAPAVPVAAAPAAEGEPEAVKPKTRRPRPTRATPAQASKPAAKGPARRSRSAAKVAVVADEPEPSTPAPKPRVRRSPAKASAEAAGRKAAEGAAGEAGDEGIWKRFTSGRATRRRTAPKPPTEG